MEAKWDAGNFNPPEEIGLVQLGHKNLTAGSAYVVNIRDT